MLNQNEHFIHILAISCLIRASLGPTAHREQFSRCTSFSPSKSTEMIRIMFKQDLIILPALDYAVGLDLVCL